MLAIGKAVKESKQGNASSRPRIRKGRKTNGKRGGKQAAQQQEEKVALSVECRKPSTTQADFWAHPPTPAIKPEPLKKFQEGKN